MFTDVKLAQDLCDNEGKRASMTIVKDRVRHILCATPLAYEDDLCDKVRDCFTTLAEILKINLSEEEQGNLEDYVSEVRDEVLERFENLVGSRIVYGYVEY